MAKGNNQSPAVEAFEEYAQQRIWHYARNTRHGIAVTQVILSMFSDFFIAGVVWGKEQERKKRKDTAKKKR